jgi:hypothetical protein
MLQVVAVLWTLRSSDVDPDDGCIAYPRNVGTEFHFDMTDCPTRFNEFVRRESLNFTHDICKMDKGNAPENAKLSCSVQCSIQN